MCTRVRKLLVFFPEKGGVRINKVYEFLETVRYLQVMFQALDPRRM